MMMTSPCNSAHPIRFTIAMLALAGMAACDSPSPEEPANSTPALATAAPRAAVTPTVFATGLRFPRGFTWGPDGSLYVAEAGSGGTHSTTAAQCTQAGPPVGPYTNGTTARVSRIKPNGNRTNFAIGFPSGFNGVGDIIGVADVAFLHGELYALSAGGGCSHGTRATPAGVAKIAADGSWHIVADLSAYQASHPVAQPSGDFEPDGTWYSLVAGTDQLFAVEPNHGEVVRIRPETGKIFRITDLSASQGHVVPTTLALHDGALFVSNLGTFPITTGAERVFRIDRQSGSVGIVKRNLTTVLGLDFDDHGRMYVLETTEGGGFPVPGTGRVLRFNKDGTRSVIVKGLFFPTAMRFGPDGRLYISNKGYGPPQPGEILRVDVP
jgi:sugar lactone lactonase YvrE